MGFMFNSDKSTKNDLFCCFSLKNERHKTQKCKENEEKRHKITAKIAKIAVCCHPAPCCYHL